MRRLPGCYLDAVDGVGVNAFLDPPFRDGCPVPFLEMQNALRSLQPQNYTVLAAQSGGAKSVFLGQVGEMAAVSGRRAVIFSLEMKPVRMWRRIVYGRAKVDSYDAGSFTTIQREELQRQHALVARLQENLLIVGDGRTTPASARAYLDSLKNDYGWVPDLIGFDYLQMMKADIPTRSRKERVDSVSEELNAMKNDYDCHVLALSQITVQPGEQEPDEGWVRDSRDIFFNVDNMIFLWTPDEMKEANKLRESQDGTREMMWKIGKARDGKCPAEGACTYIPAWTRFHLDWTPKKKLAAA